MHGYSLFFKRKIGPGKGRAFVSLGKKLEETRYHFADAAIQGTDTWCNENTGQPVDLGIMVFLERYSKSINVALRFIVSRHLFQIGAIPVPRD
jgi:hypothetical protein